MPSPEEIEETLSDIANDRIRALAAHILKGTSIPRSWGGNFNEDDQFLNQINQWRQSGYIERLPLAELDNKQLIRMQEMELKLVEKLAYQFQKDHQPEKPEMPKTLVTNFNTLGSSAKSPSRPSTPSPSAKENIVNDALDTTKDDVLHLLNERKIEISKETKGFRKGHDQRLFAISEIIEEVKKQNGKFTLDDIENKIIERLSKENPNKKGVFEQGIREHSTQNKNENSRYKIMKDRINELTSPEVRRTPTLK